MDSATVQLSAAAALPASLGVPTATATAFYAFHRVHCLWRWHRNAQDVLSEGNNFYKLAAGYAFQWLVGDSLLLRIAAQAVVITRRLIDLSAQRQEFANACRLWGDAIRGRCITRVAISPSTFSQHRLFSPSSAADWKGLFTSMVYAAARIVVCTLNVFREAFKLSMCIMDLIDAFTLAPEKTGESVNMLFINSGKIVDSLVNNKEVLLLELDQHKEFIEQLLTQAGSRYKVRDLADGIEKAITRAEQLSRAAGHVPAAVGYGLREGTYSLLYGATGWAPQFLLASKAQAPAAQSSRRYYDGDSSLHTTCPC